MRRTHRPFRLTVSLASTVQLGFVWMAELEAPHGFHVRVADASAWDAVAGAVEVFRQTRELRREAMRKIH